ncbi:MAG: type II toxin-antitoxin system Phd/YefM family antitoxin [Lautropia sp.]|nr:type II toxin-antitoxin system Phd/YefM family antitoxin [Lautropia sp.]
MSGNVTTISARQFAHDLAGAKRAAAKGPVFITDRGTPRYVLQTIEDYYQSSTAQTDPSLLQLMRSLPETEPDFDPPPMAPMFKPATFDDHRRSGVQSLAAPHVQDPGAG